MAIKALYLSGEVVFRFISPEKGEYHEYACKRWVDSYVGHVELDLRSPDFGLVAYHDSQTNEIKYMKLNEFRSLNSLMRFISL